MVVIDNYGHGMSQQNDMNTLMAVPGIQGKGKSFLMAPTSSKKCQLWMDMQDLIGIARNWPYNVRRLMWSREWNQWDRVIIAAFAFNSVSEN